jgi:5-carboxymethyl-2-hydroxymuconate isomerase
VVGDLVIPPGETRARCVRAKEWDCSQSNGSTATIHIALD